MLPSLPPTEEARPKSLIGRILYSNLAGKVSQVPPFSWIARWLAYRFATRHMGKAASPPELRLHGSGLQGALDGIVQDVVEILGFAGAMVATFDDGEVLPVKALYIDPKLTTREQIRNWEQQASDLTGTQISMTDPGIARVDIYKKEDQKNLGVQAAHSRQYIISNELFDLFKSALVPDTLREFVRGVQQALGIRQVITVPFFIQSTGTEGATETSTTAMIKDKTEGEFVGNLFAAKGSEITKNDITVLSTFAQYVASFILSERRRIQVEVIEKLILDIQKGLNSEEAVLQRIVKGIVDDLGYIGAMVATYSEVEDALPARALYTGPHVTIEQIHHWEKQVSNHIGATFSLDDPNIAKVYLNQEPYKNNLSVKAAQERKPVSSAELFDLFTPIVPDSLREFIKGIQDGLGIRQVIAVPFFLESRKEDGSLSTELIGNLFAASRSLEIQSWEIDILNAFGQQAAAGLRNANLYKKAEDRREAAAIFGKMAFTATASVHALKNHLGVVKGNLQLLKLASQENESMAIPALKRVDDMVTLVENLQEPWKLQNDIDVDVNACIRRATEKTIGINIPWIKLNLTPGLPVKTLPEMLTEAFKVLIKNANEAMSDESIPEEARLLEIESRMIENTIQVTIEDHGMGIHPNNLKKIFEMKYTTKQSGLGFGLYWTKDYIEGLGGKIKVESTLGKGTKFTLFLPVAVDQAGVTQVATTTSLS